MVILIWLCCCKSQQREVTMGMHWRGMDNIAGIGMTVASQAVHRRTGCRDDSAWQARQELVLDAKTVDGDGS